jgi:hypothetical protein
MTQITCDRPGYWVSTLVHQCHLNALQCKCLVHIYICIPRNETVSSKTELQNSFSQFLHSYICERFIYFQDQSAYSAAGKYVDRFWEYISRSQTSVRGNWD